MRKWIVLLLVPAVLVLTSWATVSAKTEVHHIHGTVASVDGAAKTFTVTEAMKGGQTKDITFSVADTTHIAIHGKAGKLDQIKAGDSVQVKFANKGDVHHAEEISVVAPPAKPASTKK